LISQQVSIIASNHGIREGVPIQKQPWDRTRSGVRIGNDVWIGCGVQILPGVTIGDGAVVGAGSLVNRDVEPGVIVGGVPARPIGRRH
jgi:acetyltransferase-like isoleucine patch superfamily enzyme